MLNRNAVIAVGVGLLLGVAGTAALKVGDYLISAEHPAGGLLAELMVTVEPGGVLEITTATTGVDIPPCFSVVDVDRNDLLGTILPTETKTFVARVGTYMIELRTACPGV